MTIIVSTGAGSVIVPNVEGQTESSARTNLIGKGLNVVIDEEETLEESEDGDVIDQAPARGHPRRDGRHGDDRRGCLRGAAGGGAAARGGGTRHPKAAGFAAMKVVVLSGGRSSEHEVSLESGKSVAEGLRAAGHEPVAVLIERDGALVARRRAGRARARGRAARRRRRVPGPARAVRRGRDGPGPARVPRRPLRRARACSPPRSRWTSSSSSACCAFHGLPQVAFCEVGEEGWREHRRRRWARRSG